MAALDLYFGQTGNGEAVVLRDVVIAPGPSVFSEMLLWLSDGRASGIWSPHYADVLVEGGSLRSLLEKIKSIETPLLGLDEQGPTHALRGSLTDELPYWVKAIEY